MSKSQPLLPPLPTLGRPTTARTGFSRTARLLENEALAAVQVNLKRAASYLEALETGGPSTPDEVLHAARWELELAHTDLAHLKGTGTRQRKLGELHACINRYGLLAGQVQEAERGRMDSFAERSGHALPELVALAEKAVPVARQGREPPAPREVAARIALGYEVEVWTRPLELPWSGGVLAMPGIYPIDTVEGLTKHVEWIEDLRRAATSEAPATGAGPSTGSG